MKKYVKWIILALLVLAYLFGSAKGFLSIEFLIMLALALILAYLYFAPFVYYIMGMRAFTLGDRDKAIKRVQKSTKGPFASKDNLINYAYYILREGEADKAKDILESVIDNKKSTETEILNAKSNLAILYSKTGEFGKAVSLIKDVFDKTKNTNTYGTYGYFLLLDGRVDEALEINKEAFEYNENNKTIRDNLALNYYMLGEFDKAEEIYDKLMEENPTFIDAYYNAAKVKVQLGKKDEAKELFEKAKTINLSFLSNVTYEQIDKEIKEL